jgi:hypothetical protein
LAGREVRRGTLAVVAVLVLAPTAQAKSIGGLARDVRGPHATARSAASNSLSYQGGPVLHANRTHLIFWQPSGSGLSFEPGYVRLVQAFVANVAADSHRTTNPYSLSGQYTDSGGPAAYDSTSGGSVMVSDPLPANGCLEPPVTGPGWTVCLTDDQLSSEIRQVVQSHHLPTTSRDVYFLITPKGLGNCLDSSSTSCALGGQVGGYCGYHTSTAAGVILYAVIPYNAVPGHCQSGNPRPNGNPADPALSTVSHEHNEIITDPLDDAWIDGQGNENGDLCITSFGPNIGGSGEGAFNELIHGGRYYLQEEWSNADGSCQPRARPDSASFSARRGQSARSVTLTGTAAAPAPRRIVAFHWVFGDGRSGAGRTVTHRFPRARSYNVQLRAVDSWGNWAVYTRTIRVSGAGR